MAGVNHRSSDCLLRIPFFGVRKCRSKIHGHWSPFMGVVTPCSRNLTMRHSFSAIFFFLFIYYLKFHDPTHLRDYKEFDQQNFR